MNVTVNGEQLNPYLTYGYDNELQRVDGTRTSVDDDGNLLKYKLNGKEYVATYDSKNRLVSYDGVTYSYDLENNRVGLSADGEETSFIVDNDSSKYSQVLVESSGDNQRHHVYGNGLIGSYVEGSFETNHYDYRGSTTAVSGEDGAVIGSVEYDEYGVVLSKDDAVTTRFLYNGKYGVQTDSNGLYQMRARYYNPDLKRFMNRDVVLGSIEQSQTLNRYAYVNGNPISFNDPFGLAREAIQDTKFDFMATLHTGLDIAGMIPVLGAVPDLVNAVTYLAEGDYGNAALSGVGAVPLVGDAVIGVKLGVKAVKYADGIAEPLKKGYNGFKDALDSFDFGPQLATASGVTTVSNRVASHDKTLSSNLQFFAGKNDSGSVISKKKRKPYSNPKNRPKYASNQVETVWESAKDIDGKVYDPNTGDELFWDRSKSRAGQWDMGHTQENKYSEWHQKYLNDEITKKEFLDWYRDPDNYRPEDPSANRSHKYE